MSAEHRAVVELLDLVRAADDLAAAVGGLELDESSWPDFVETHQALTDVLGVYLAKRRASGLAPA